MNNKSESDLWFENEVSKLVSDLDSVKSLGYDLLNSFEFKEELANLKSAMLSMQELGNSFYNDKEKDEKTGIVAVNRVFSEISPIRTKIINSVSDLIRKLKMEELDIKNWLGDQMNHLLMISYRLIYDTTDYVRQVANKLGVTSFSTTFGTFGVSLSLDFTIEKKST